MTTLLWNITTTENYDHESDENVIRGNLVINEVEVADAREDGYKKMNVKDIDLTEAMELEGIEADQEKLDAGARILFTMPLGLIIKQSKIEEDVTIYDSRPHLVKKAMRDQTGKLAEREVGNFAAYLNLMQSGMVFERDIVSYLVTNFLEHQCEKSEADRDLDNAAGREAVNTVCPVSKINDVDGMPEI